MSEVPQLGTSSDDPSGRLAAEAAYEAGAVEPTAALDNYDVALSVIVRGDMAHAESVAQGITLELLARSDVTTAVYAVSRR